MTVDQMDQQIIAVKKQGLTPYVERHKIAMVRQTYFMEKIQAERNNFTALLMRNIAFLNRIHKTKLSTYNVQEHMGLKTDQYFQELIEGKSFLLNFEHILLCAAFFGIPSDLLLFIDLEANEQTIRKEYPSLFKQSGY